jgi:hypothetical protein
MDVKDGLPRAGSCIHNYAESIRDPKAPGKFGGHAVQMSDQRLIRLLRFERGGKVFSRNYQQVHRSLRIYVLKCDAASIFMDHLGRYLSRRNFAE